MGLRKGDKGQNNNVGFSFEDSASESSENRRFRLPHCRLTRILQRTSANIHIRLIMRETRVTRLHLRRRQHGSIFIRIFVVGSERRMFCANEVRNGRSRSSKVIDFGTNRKCVCNFLLVINSNAGPILPRFGDIAGFLLSTVTQPHWSRLPVLGRRRAKTLS